MRAIATRLKSVLLPARRRRAPSCPPPFLTLAEAIGITGARWHPAIAPATVRRPPTTRIGDVDVDWNGRLSATHSEMGVVELPRGYAITSAGWPVAPSGAVISDTTWYGRFSAEVINGPPPAAPRSIRGTALSLLSDWSQGNYYHFLIDALGRYGIYERIAATLPDVAAILCPKPLTSKFERWIDLLGIDRRKVVFITNGERVQADRTLVPSFPGERRDMAGWMPDFWRMRRFGGTPMGGARKLYLPRRSTTRAISNAAEMEATLRTRGFEIVDPARIEQPERLFAEATIVIGAHGAALTDCIFCPPGALLAEIAPSDHIYAYYYCLAGAAGLRYAYVVGNSEGRRAPGALGPSPHDLTVDVSVLADWLDSLEAMSNVA